MNLMWFFMRLLHEEEKMIRGNRAENSAAWITMLWLCVVLLQSVTASGEESPPGLEMPSHWKMVSDFQLQPEQAKEMGNNLGAWPQQCAKYSL
jgi:hypothetical protein